MVNLLRQTRVGIAARSIPQKSSSEAKLLFHTMPFIALALSLFVLDATAQEANQPIVDGAALIELAADRGDLIIDIPRVAHEGLREATDYKVDISVGYLQGDSFQPVVPTIRANRSIELTRSMYDRKEVVDPTGAAIVVASEDIRRALRLTERHLNGQPLLVRLRFSGTVAVRFEYFKPRGKPYDGKYGAMTPTAQRVGVVAVDVERDVILPLTGLLQVDYPIEGRVLHTVRPANSSGKGVAELNAELRIEWTEPLPANFEPYVFPSPLRVDLTNLNYGLTDDARVNVHMQLQDASELTIWQRTACLKLTDGFWGGAVNNRNVAKPCAQLDARVEKSNLQVEREYVRMGGYFLIDTDTFAQQHCNIEDCYLEIHLTGSFDDSYNSSRIQQNRLSSRRVRVVKQRTKTLDFAAPLISLADLPSTALVQFEDGSVEPGKTDLSLEIEVDVRRYFHWNSHTPVEFGASSTRILPISSDDI